MVAGKERYQGLGTHADPLFGSDSPKAPPPCGQKIALDDGGALRDGELTPASVRFLVYDREPVGYDMTNDNFNLKSSNPQSLPANSRCRAG